MFSLASALISPIFSIFWCQCNHTARQTPATRPDRLDHDGKLVDRSTMVDHEWRQSRSCVALYDLLLAFSIPRSKCILNLIFSLQSDQLNHPRQLLRSFRGLLTATSRFISSMFFTSSLSELCSITKLS